MKAADAITNKFGRQMMESIGVRTPTLGTSNVATPPKVIAMASPDDGLSRHREAHIIDIDRITPDPNQVRKVFDEASIDEMAESLKAHGQIANILVRWDAGLGKYVIIAGERRFRGATRAGLKSLKCTVYEGDLSESQIRVLQLTENVQRDNLRPIELAKSFAELMQTNSWTMDQLATHIKKSKPTISRTLALLKLPEDVQQKVESGELAASAAYELTKRGTEAEQREEAARIIAEGVTRDEVAGRKKPSPSRNGEAQADGEQHHDKAKPASKVIKLQNATVSIKWTKTRIRRADIITALEAALEEIRGETKETPEA